MNEKEIQKHHDRGFVVLKASRATNAPVGWKHTGKNKKVKWGYTGEMQDPALTVYRKTFNALALSHSHCGFYMGHANLCCIDLDTKHSTIEVTTALKDLIVKKLDAYVCVERTKSNGFHIYFLYDQRLDNSPNFTGLGKENWIELYYAKRFVASYLSNSKKYVLEHRNILEIKQLQNAQLKILLACLQPYKADETKERKHVTKQQPVDKETLQRAEAYVSQLEAKGEDITGDNPTWFKIGKALANAFGSAGYDLFNRVSQFSSSYNADTIEDVYNRFVADEARAPSKRITIGSFFKMCEDAGLLSLEAQQAVQLHPVSDEKEFTLTLLKKERMPEHVHALCVAFLQHVEICCIDGQSFYIFEHTHWIRRTPRYVIDLINNFVDRSDVDDKYRKLLRTVPYIKMALEELRLTTQREALEPRVGNLHEGVFVNMENGVLHVNIKTGKRKLLDHESSYNFTTVLPFCYEPAASCERFDIWMQTQIPDATLHEVYYAFVASCLTRHKADIIMLLAGGTSTGKSSLIDLTSRVIGKDNSVAISAGILFGGTSEAAAQAMQMENSLLAYDIDAQPFKHLEYLLKAAAQEPLPGWQMNVARRPVINYGRIMIAMNPANYSVFNDAVARRFITINMDVPVVKDNNVMPAIYENELAGIFNHVLNIGVKHLISNNGQIKVTESMRKATLDFHTRKRDAVRWFEANYATLILPDAKFKATSKFTHESKLHMLNPDVDVKFTTVSDMYQQYRAWLVDVEGYNENKLPIRKYFAADLELIPIKDTVQVINSETKRGVFVGIKRG